MLVVILFIFQTQISTISYFLLCITDASLPQPITIYQHIIYKAVQLLQYLT